MREHKKLDGEKYHIPQAWTASGGCMMPSRWVELSSYNTDSLYVDDSG